MIQELAQQNLTDIYFLIRDIPGWIGNCVKADFSVEEIEYMEHLDEEMGDYQPMEEVREWEEEMAHKGGIEVFYSESDAEKIKILSAKILNVSREILFLIKAGKGMLEMKLAESRLRDFENLRDHTRNIEIHKTMPYERFTEWEIQTAREVPLSEIIPNLPRSMRIPCPFHQGKDPNFSIKGKWGHCFVCEENVDSLGWLMKIERMSFVDAVKYLLRR